MTGVAIPTGAKVMGSVENLLAIWAQATEAEIVAGKLWYSEAHNVALVLSSTYDIPLWTASGVIAAISPRLQWPVNVAEAAVICKAWREGVWAWRPAFGTVSFKVAAQGMPDLGLTAMRVNVAKAFAILDGHDSALQGPKVTSFRRNIADPFGSAAVTVDSHAVMAWLGILATGSYQFSGAWYADVVADYTEAARQVGVSPSRFQATVWVAKKRLASSPSSLAVAIFDAYRKA